MQKSLVDLPKFPGMLEKIFRGDHDQTIKARVMKFGRHDLVVLLLIYAKFGVYITSGSENISSSTPLHPSRGYLSQSQIWLLQWPGGLEL